MTDNERAVVDAVISDPRVQALRKPPPSAPPGKWARVRRVARAALQLIGVLAFALAIYTNHLQGQTAKCVNDTLASRNARIAGVSTDAQAHIAFARSLDALLRTPRAEQPVKVREFKAEVQDYVRDLSANQAARDAHPLGRC